MLSYNRDSSRDRVTQGYLALPPRLYRDILHLLRAQEWRKKLCSATRTVPRQQALVILDHESEYSERRFARLVAMGRGSVLLKKPINLDYEVPRSTPSNCGLRR